MTRYALTIRGRERRWSFEITGVTPDPAAWLADGLEVHELVQSIPAPEMLDAALLKLKRGDA